MTHHWKRLPVVGKGSGLKEAFWCKRKGLLTKAVLLLHDNAGLQNSWRWKILPDLAPSDFHLFS
jgi:hypothetical protein